jgi:hypothetical protein
MARELRSVDEVIARMDETFARYDGRSPAPGAPARRRSGRSTVSVARKLANMGVALGILIAATIGFGLIVGPIGITGLFLVAMGILAILLFFSVWNGRPAPKPVPYSDELSTSAVVRQLDSILASERRALPAPAAMRVDTISAQLPLLESRLGEVDPLDPLAQDARRLMGKHLPELIERYERIPATHRHQPDGEGLTADQRLVTSLDAAAQALGDIGERLTQSDRQAFETHGRFIESRYKESGGFKGE